MVPDSAPERLSGLVWIPISGKTKEPRVRFKHAEVGRWSPRETDGYGILTGPTKNDLWVWGLDLDIGDLDGVLGGEGKQQFENFLKENGHEWPETFTVKTSSGGIHLYFILEEGKWVKGSAKSKKYLFGEYSNPCIDVRGGRMVDGVIAGTGYLKAPPSDGYEVIKDVPFIVAPEWLYEIVKWEPRRRVERTRKQGITAPTGSRLSRMLSRSSGDPVARAQGWVRSAIKGMTEELEALWEQESGWRETGLKVTASLAGLVENDLLFEHGIFSEDDAWEVLEEWSELMDDGEGFYEKHLEPMFLGKLGAADPCLLPEDLEDALLGIEKKDSTPPSGEIEIVGLDEFLTENVDCEPPKWLIPNWIMGSGLNVLTGAQKSTKSTIAGMIAAKVPGKVAWFSKDGESLGTTRERLISSGLPSGKSYIIPDSATSDFEDFISLLEKMSTELGDAGLIIIDSVSGANRYLGENQYKEALVRDMWMEARAASGKTSMLLIAHGSSRNTENILRGSEAVHQILDHLLACSNNRNVVEITVPFSRYMLSGVKIASGRLPIPDPKDSVEPILIDYRVAEGGTLYAVERQDGLLTLVERLSGSKGIGEGTECSEDLWPEESGLSLSALIEAEACGLIRRRDENKGRFSYEFTPYYSYLRGGAGEFDLFDDDEDEEW